MLGSSVLMLCHGCAELGFPPITSAENKTQPYKVKRFDPADRDRQVTGMIARLSERDQNGLPQDQLGYYMDVQEARFRQVLHGQRARLSRESESITVQISGTDAFATNSDRLNREVLPLLTKVSNVLTEFDKTLILVNSHTDNTGGAGYNQRLSEKRAIAVAQFLIERGVWPERIGVIGYGESKPLSGLSDSSDQWPDRRIEIKLVAIARKTTP